MRELTGCANTGAKTVGQDVGFGAKMVPFYYYHFDLIIKVKYFQKNTVRNG
jgi:hypothetical protein